MRLLVFSMFLVMLAIGNPLDYYEEESQLDPSNAYMLPLSAQEPGYNIYNRQLRLMKARAGLTDKGLMMRLGKRKASKEFALRLGKRSIQDDILDERHFYQKNPAVEY